MFDFTSGLITAGYAVASLFFLRYWFRSREALFLAFSGAFLLLAFNQLALVFSGVATEVPPNFWTMRDMVGGMTND